MRVDTLDVLLTGRDGVVSHVTAVFNDGVNYLQAFGIIVENVLRVLAINSVGTFVLFLGKIGVMAACGAISVLWLKVA